jgi:hypothetical protein
VKNFEVGMLAHALAHGTQYCNFYPGHLENNKVNIKIAPEATGWVNQNNWIGGRPSHQSAEGSTPVTGCAHIVIAANANVVNSNVFYSTTLESIGTVEYHLDCAGTFNSFINCRWENSAGSALRKVMWRATSASNSIVGGISSDLITYVTEPGADNPGTAVKLNSFATSNLPPIGTGGMVIDSTLQRPVWSPNGVDIKTIATLDDIELQLTGVGIPEGVVTATPGSLYTRTDGGQRVNLCKRPISSTVAASTGWAAAGGTISVGSGYLRNTLSIATGTRAIVTSPLNSNAVLPGHTYSFSIQGRSNNPAVTFWTLVKVYDASFTQLDLKTAAAVSLDTTNFTTLPTVVYTMPANAAWAYIALYYSAGTSTIGDTLDLRRVMYEETPYPGPYIDGDLSNAGGVTYGWTGAANASTSTGDTQSAPVSFVKTGSGNTGWKPIVNATSISVAAAATDPATTQALVNGIRASLITAGILS